VGPSIGFEEPAIPRALKLSFFADWHQNSQHLLLSVSSAFHS